MDSGLAVKVASVTSAPLSQETMANMANPMAITQAPTTHHLCLAQARANDSVQLRFFI
jgi:hypothetical protein